MLRHQECFAHHLSPLDSRAAVRLRHAELTSEGRLTDRSVTCTLLVGLVCIAGPCKTKTTEITCFHFTSYPPCHLLCPTPNHTHVRKPSANRDALAALAWLTVQCSARRLSAVSPKFKPATQRPDNLLTILHRIHHNAGIPPTSHRLVKGCCLRSY